MKSKPGAQALKSCTPLLPPDSLADSYRSGTVLGARVNVTDEPQSTKAGSEDGIGEYKQPSRAWALGCEVRVLWANPDGVGQRWLPAEVVPTVSLGDEASETEESGLGQ